MNGGAAAARSVFERSFIEMNKAVVLSFAIVCILMPNGMRMLAHCNRLHHLELHAEREAVLGQLRGKHAQFSSLKFLLPSYQSLVPSSVSSCNLRSGLISGAWPPALVNMARPVSSTRAEAL